MDNYIICAGVDYETSHRGFRGWNFKEYAVERRRQLIKKSQHGRDIRVLILDCLSGIEETVTVIWKDGKPTEARKTEKKFAPITKASYKGHAFRDGQPSVMSIVNLYRAIQNVGKMEPGTLFEVSIFSHSIFKGPILVNSYEDAEHDPTHNDSATTRLRDPDDKDGRHWKDFYDPNMTNEELRFFRGAFHKEGHVWIWGCNIPPNINAMMHRVERTGKSLAAPQEVIELKNLTHEQIGYFKIFSDVLKFDLEVLTKKYRCKFLLGDFVRLIAGATENTYPYKLASVARIRTIAALLGTSAVPDKSNRHLMMVDGAKHVAFHKHHFRIKTDAEGRNYGIFEPISNDLTS